MFRVWGGFSHGGGGGCGSRGIQLYTYVSHGPCRPCRPSQLIDSFHHKLVENPLSAIALGEYGTKNKDGNIVEVEVVPKL